MKAQSPVGLALSWPRLTTVFLIDVAVLTAASRWPEEWQNDDVAWWVGVGVAAVVTLTAILTYRGMPIGTALARWMSAFSVHPDAVLALGCTPPVDHQRKFGADVVGIREHRGMLVAVLAVAGPAVAGTAVAGTGRHRQAEVPPATLPVAAVVAGLRQFDVRLESIDIVSVRMPAETADGSGAADGAAHTWLVLRMDPQHNVAAVAARDSVAATLAAATERLAHALDTRDRVARPLTAEEFADVDAAVLAGLDLDGHRPGLRVLKDDHGYSTSFWVSPSDITAETLEELWLSESDATVLTVQLALCHRQPEVSAWVRYHSADPLTREMYDGLNRLVGRQLAAVRASMPAPSPRPPLTVPARVLAGDEQLGVPLG